MSPFICARCLKSVDVYHRIERRIEFRDARTQARYAVLLDSKICKACADEEIAETRPVLKQAGLGL